MGIVIVAIFSTYTINTLLKCGARVMEMQGSLQEATSPPSYPEIGRAAMGKAGIYWCLLCL